jgi:hypothetical protein
MEKSLEAVLDWAEVIVITQEATPETTQIIARHSVPVIDVTISQGEELAHVAES